VSAPTIWDAKPKSTISRLNSGDSETMRKGFSGATG
jgi:hypothetical protein